MALVPVGSSAAGDGDKRMLGGCKSRTVSGSAKAASSIFLVADIPGDKGFCPGTFHADVYTVKDKPVRLTFIDFNYVDYVCTPSDPSEPPFILEEEGRSLPTAKLKKQGNKYPFEIVQGEGELVSTMSGRVSKNGTKLRARVELRLESGPPDYALCRATFALEAAG